MEQCECYKTRTINMTGLKDCAGYKMPWHETYTEGYCLGTKECELCQCNGDKSRCDFYDYIRKEAKKMNTAEMIADSLKNKESTYVSKSKFSGGLWYSSSKGFHYDTGENITHVDYLSTIMGLQDWVCYKIPVMTKSEAEAKFNIKIMG